MYSSLDLRFLISLESCKANAFIKFSSSTFSSVSKTQLAIINNTEIAEVAAVPQNKSITANITAQACKITDVKTTIELMKILCAYS
jgi:molybdenum cofactor biosynthesis enzyme